MQSQNVTQMIGLSCSIVMLCKLHTRHLQFVFCRQASSSLPTFLSKKWNGESWCKVIMNCCFKLIFRSDRVILIAEVVFIVVASHYGNVFYYLKDDLILINMFAI